MQLISAVIRPHRLNEVKEALFAVNIAGLTVSEVRGVGKQKTKVERYRGSEYKFDLMAKVKIEVAVTDDQLQTAIDTIRKAALTGEVGDGKIFITPLDEVVRIRTGERGEDAL
ncbi:MAG: P-II family nitrogen regulator [Acidobacteriota bacterium]|jgi:nitrogen regulatory protein PII|nr:P-II family nitrogen regulator [Acidobacteriota bacterium]